jgi:hypothetical protein
MKMHNLYQQYHIDKIKLRDEFFPLIQLLRTALNQREQLCRRLREQDALYRTDRNTGFIHVLETGRKLILAEIRLANDAYAVTVGGEFEARRVSLDNEYNAFKFGATT